MTYRDLKNSIQAHQLMSPIAPEGCVGVGVSLCRARQQLRENGYDYGLVLHNGRVEGFVANADLPKRDEPLALEPPVRKLTVEYVIAETTPISDLIRYLAAFPFQVVVRKKDVLGVVHDSDLNKHAVHSYFYLLSGYLEECLLSVVRKDFAATQRWRPFLAKKRWEQVHAAWRHAKKRNVHVDPLYYLAIPDYLRILGSDPGALRTLGFQFQGQWKDSIRGIEELSKALLRAGHRPIRAHWSAAELVGIEQRVLDLIDRTELGLQQHLVTVMFTDIVGSTRFYDRHGDAVGVMMVQRVMDTLMPIIDQHRGTVVKTIGDAVLAYFTDAHSAVRCSIQMQVAFRKLNVKTVPDERIRIRAALNHGPALLKDNDLFGDAVNLAARILGKAEPDETLISGSVYKHIGEHSDVRVRLKEKGAQLKGKEEKVDLYAVTWHMPAPATAA